MSKGIEKLVAKGIEKLAEKSALNAVGKKVIIMLYEPEIPEAVKSFINKKTK
ncbi:MAG: hypothetical protein Q4C65_03775 [Eubacteriales bacterium]|nr:hypothetical protein [Eubacteriales bacterium]